MGHLVFNGDALFALGDINLLVTDFRDWNTKGQVIVIFHGDAAYLARSIAIRTNQTIARKRTQTHRK